MTILVICGLKQEASLAAGSGITVVAGGGSRSALEARLAELGAAPFEAVVSFGLAGALVPTLSVGDLVLPQIVVQGDGSSFTVDAGLHARWVSCTATDPAARPSASVLLASDRPIALAAEKRALGSRADAVDMESGIAGAYAARRGLPFGVVRVISDGAEHDLPALVATAMRPDGGIAVGRVLAGLARAPGDLPALLRTARDAGRAMRVLGRVRGLLGPRLGFDF